MSIRKSQEMENSPLASHPVLMCDHITHRHALQTTEGLHTQRDVTSLLFLNSTSDNLKEHFQNLQALDYFRM